jgi:ribosomal-protein-alanine N-acetyltransferase
MTPAELARLHAASFTVPRPWDESEFRALIASPGVFLLTRDTGFLLGRSAAGEAEILTLAVDPAARRQGTGRALVADFLAEARARGAERAFLEVAADNAAAAALYRQAGFAEAGRRRGYFAAPGRAAVDATVMTCPI